MRQLLAVAIFMIIGISSRAQSLVECQYLFDAGYWSKAETAYQTLLENLPDNSTEYYKALSLYGEVLYHLDKRGMADSVLKLASDRMAGQALKLNEQALEIVQRNSLYSSKTSFKEWGVTQINKVNVDALMDDGELDINSHNLRNPHLLQILGCKFLKRGITLLAKKNLILAENAISHNYYGNPKDLEDLRMLRCWQQYYYTITNYQMLNQICEDVIDILTERGLTDGVYYPEALCYNAVALAQLGRHKESLEMHNQALTLFRENLGENHSRYAWALYLKGQSLGMICEFNDMLDCEKKAAELYRNTLGDHNPDYSAALSEIGMAYSMLNDTTNEFKYYHLALEANKKAIGEGALATGRQYYSMSLAYSKHQNYDMALEYIKKANRIALTQTGTNSVFTADCLTQRAAINIELGKYKIANGFLQGALKIYENVLSPNSPKLAHALVTLGNCQYGQESFDKASQNIQRAVGIYRRDLINNFAFMTSQMRSAYWENTAGDFSAITKLCWKNPESSTTTETAFACELIAKGIKLSSEIEFSNIISKSNNPALRRKYAALQEMRQTIAMEQDLPLSEMSTNIDSLIEASEALERELMQNSSEYGDLCRQIRVAYPDVRNALHGNDVAIEFTKIQSASDTKYGALIMKAGWSSPKFVDLFTDAEFGEKFGTAIKPYTNTELFKMAWEPMVKYFDSNSRIYFAPTGLLFNTAIEYAPTDVDNDILISDEYQIFRISSTRDLVIPKERNRSNTIAVYGGISYDTDTTTMREQSEAYASRTVRSEFIKSLIDRTGGLDADYLPGTEKESKAIVEYMRESDFQTEYYTADKANEESFKNLSGKDLRIIHIATHGFYLDDRKHSLSGDNSLLMSGLLMSGCNNINIVPQGIEDGILTAREISYLDLRNTDMVVLSACETALGKVTDDGVYGLQRGFKKAGANTIIMSLWPVNDYATRLLMTNFYKYMKEGQSKHEAFQNSQLDLRSHNGVTPSHWAAFIMLDGE